MKCKKCNSENLVMRPNAKNPSATELICANCGTWQKFIGKEEIRLFEIHHQKQVPSPTNADRIRSMNDEELAEFITLSPEMEFDVCLCCKNGNPYPDDRGICLTKHGHCEAEARCEALKDWLRQPAKEE